MRLLSLRRNTSSTEQPRSPERKVDSARTHASFPAASVADFEGWTQSPRQWEDLLQGGSDGELKLEAWVATEQKNQVSSLDALHKQAVSPRIQRARCKAQTTALAAFYGVQPLTRPGKGK